MSVINKMLKDLDERGASTAPVEGIPRGLGTPLPTGHEPVRWKKYAWLAVIPVVLIAAWIGLRPGDAPPAKDSVKKTAPQIAQVAPPPPPAAPAPVAAEPKAAEVKPASPPAAPEAKAVEEKKVPAPAATVAKPEEKKPAPQPPVQVAAVAPPPAPATKAPEAAPAKVDSKPTAIVKTPEPVPAKTEPKSTPVAKAPDPAPVKAQTQPAPVIKAPQPAPTKAEPKPAPVARAPEAPPAKADSAPAPAAKTAAAPASKPESKPSPVAAVVSKPVAKAAEPKKPEAKSEKPAPKPAAVLQAAAPGKPAASKAEEPAAAKPAAIAAVPTAETPKPSISVERKTGSSVTELAAAEYRKASELMRDGRIDSAIEGFASALRVDAKHAAARQAMVALLIQRGRRADAQAALKEGLGVLPENAGWAMLLARLQVDAGDAAGASQTLDAALPYAKNRADYHAFAGTVLQMQGRHREAAAHYEIAVQLAPDSGRALIGLAISLEEDKRLSEARAVYERALASGGLGQELQSYVERKIAQLK